MTATLARSTQLFENKGENNKNLHLHYVYQNIKAVSYVIYILE
jgi:ABC-type long-subunit fatty acid transport system fused permease/ATPase subunit